MRRSGTTKKKEVPAMMAWIGKFIDVVFIWCPRRFHVKATHGAVKFIRAKAVECKPGCHWYWPWTSTVEEIATAEQTHNLPTQAIENNGTKPLAVSGVIVYKVTDTLAALSKSFEVDDTINDVGLTAIMEIVGPKTKAELKKALKSGSLTKQLTFMTRRRLKKYGIYVERCSLTDFTSCMPILNLGDGPTVTPVPAEGAE
jgi:regulator of protease activity HflC (stomatin/prohibitin superfamily)